MREATFVIDSDIPTSVRAKLDFKWQLKNQAATMDHVFGKHGGTVGLGFLWETQTGIGDGGLSAVCTLARRIQRAYLNTGILHRSADCYLLGGRIRYIREGEPRATLTLKEGT